MRKRPDIVSAVRAFFEAQDLAQRAEYFDKIAEGIASMYRAGFEFEMKKLDPALVSQFQFRKPGSKHRAAIAYSVSGAPLAEPAVLVGTLLGEKTEMSLETFIAQQNDHISTPSKNAEPKP